MRFKKIYVEITNICNLSCSFCSKDNHIPKELTLQEFDTILNKIRHYTNSIYLHVKGEPLLHTKLKEILEITKKYNIKVNITTNGTLLKQKVNILQKFDNIRQINISLHSENNYPNYFDNIFETSDLLSKNINIVYRIWTLNNHNANILSTKGVDKIIKHYNLDKNTQKKLVNDKNIKVKDNIYLDKDIEFIWPNSVNDNSNDNGTCLGTRSHIAILVNGDVVPCCLDSKGILKLGNIFEDDMLDILNSKLFKEINNGFKNNKLVCNLCKNCNFRKQKFN